MAKRNKIDLSLVWVHVDMLHPAIDTLINTSRTRHETGETYKLSVNVSRDGTEALVKIANADKAWAAGLGVAPLVKAVFDEADHHLALALVTTPEWLPLPE